MSRSPISMMPPADDDLSRGEVRTVCVVVWRHSVTQARFNLQREALARSIARHGKQTAFLCIVEPKTSPPEDKLRRASVEMITSHRGTLSCVACVIEGNGFAAAAVRSVFSAMHILGAALVTGSVPVSYFATVAEAASWMSKYVEIGSYEQFRKEVEAVRAKRPSVAG